MTTRVRIATWNLENFGDEAQKTPSIQERIAVMRPQLERLRADVLVLQEVASQKKDGKRELLALQELFTGTPYSASTPYTTVDDNGQPYRVRNLVVATPFDMIDKKQVQSDKFKLTYRKLTADPPAAAEELTWERPILHLTLSIDGKNLHVLNLHLKSRLPADIEGQQEKYMWKTASGWAEGYFISSMKRVGQALEARMLIDSIFEDDKDALLAVCGDLNSEPDEVPVRAICGPVEETENPALVGRQLVPCENTIPSTSRYTLLHLGQGQMFDHILASRSLLRYYRGAEIHNELLHDESGAFRTDDKFPESDHAPVVAEFELP